MATSEELLRYQAVLENRQHTSDNATDPAVEELRMAPLVWWDVKEHFELQQQVQRGYAVLGHVLKNNDSASNDSANNDSSNNDSSNNDIVMLDDASPTPIRPVLLNTDSPWSAFLCGSQGSGKSHSLSCMLENCLLKDKTILPKIGLNPNPLAGLVFHYDRCQGSGVCEAAYLCTRVPTTVLVSPSNHGRLEKAYKDMARKQGAEITVEQLYILPKYLDTERMKTLMAVGGKDEMPLYMQVSSFPTLVSTRANMFRPSS
jgi:hypothetical protein